MKWQDLPSEPAVMDALIHAGIRLENGTQNEKRRWSERFADGCAVAIADSFRYSSLASKRIRPENLDNGTEPLTPLGSGTSKRIDVTVSDDLLGLEIGVSLKGLNFRDGGSQSYDKNLTGRLYELGDEVRLVHEHLPHAFMVGVFFLPLASCVDKKTERANSSFTNTVMKLRERTGRLDPALAAHSARCDASFVCLYSLGQEIDGCALGAARFFPVNAPPPRRGRPILDVTINLTQMVSRIISAATHTADAVWGEAEDD